MEQKDTFFRGKKVNGNDTEILAFALKFIVWTATLICFSLILFGFISN